MFFILKRSDTIKKYTYRKASIDDVEAINQIMEQTDKEIQTDHIFVKDDKSFIETHIEENGFIILAEHKDRIVAFLLVRIPEYNSDNLGYDVNMKHEELNQVAHIESVAVIPKHRGNRLQYKMMKYAEDIIKKRGIKYSMATVSPKNKYSLINFLKRDYRIKRMKQKYSGVKRLIVQKEHKRREQT